MVASAGEKCHAHLLLYAYFSHSKLAALGWKSHEISQKVSDFFPRQVDRS